MIGFWLTNARWVALPQSVLPAILAVCMASRTEGFSIFLGILAIIGVMAGHLAMNLFDDYFDYKVKESGYRDTLNRKGFRARISKCDYLTSGKATLGQLLAVCFVFGAIALSIAAVLWYFRGNFILWIAIATAIAGISYSAPPLRLSYHGLGELVIGLMFGPMLMAGVYYAAGGHWDYSLLFVSVPVGMLVMNIVYSHAIMDYEPDKEVGKTTLAVLLKKKNRMLYLHYLLIGLPYSLVIMGVLVDFLSPYYLLSLITFPMAYEQHYLMVEFTKNPGKNFSPKWWLGPMGNWENYEKAGIGWFMIRWLSARNLLAFFCLSLIIAGLIPYPG